MYLVFSTPISHLNRTSWLAGRLKSSDAIIHLAPDISFYIDTISLSLRQEIVDCIKMPPPGNIYAPLHALPRVALLRFRICTYTNGKKKCLWEETRAKRDRGQNRYVSPSIIKNCTKSAESARLDFHVVATWFRALLYRTLHTGERVRRREFSQKRSTKWAPLARTSPPDTGHHWERDARDATRRGEGRGSFETTMLPRRG